MSRSNKIVKGNKQKLRQTKENKEEKWKPKKKSKKGKYFKSKDSLAPSAKIDIKFGQTEYDNVSAPTSTVTPNKNFATTLSVLPESMNSDFFRSYCQRQVFCIGEEVSLLMEGKLIWPTHTLWTIFCL